MLHHARSRAKKRKIECSLSIDDIIIPEFCPVLGIRLKHNTGKSGDDSPTLDRKKLDVGYTPENVCVISSRANRIKNNASPEELAKVLAYSLECNHG